MTNFTPSTESNVLRSQVYKTNNCIYGQ